MRLQKLSEAVEEAERKRDSYLYKLFGDLHQIQKDVRNLNWQDKRKIFGDLLNFRTAKKIGALVLRRVYPGLDPKKRQKYTAVLRYVAAAKPAREKVKEFVQNHGSINGCVVKEKALRKKATRRETSKR